MRTIFVFARAPQLGRVKTRLAREVGAEAALGLYVAMLRDSLEKAVLLARAVGAEVVLAHTPREAMALPPQDGVPSLGELWDGTAWPQPEGDLGARMQAAIAWAFGRGASSVCLLGADTPDMEVSVLMRDFEDLTRQGGRVDAVLQPARDGGFWALVCTRALPPAAFELDWNQDETRALLKKNLESLGLRVQRRGVLGEDVDDLAALQRLAERLRQSPHAAPHTVLWLSESKIT